MPELPDPVITDADLDAHLHTRLNNYPVGANPRYPYTNTNWIGGGAMWSDNPDNDNYAGYIRAPGDVDLNAMAAGIGAVGIHDWFELTIEEGVDYTESNTLVELRRMGLACHRLDGSWDVVTPSEDIPGPIGVLSNAQHGHYDDVRNGDGHQTVGCASDPTDAGPSYHFGALFSVTDGSVPGDISPTNQAPLRAHTSSDTSYFAGIDYLAAVDPDTIDGVVMWIEARVIKADPGGPDTPLEGIYRLLPGFDLIPTGRKISEGGPGDGWPGFWGWTLALTGDWQTGVVWTGLPEGATIVDDPPIPGYDAEGGGGGGGGGGGEPGVDEITVRFVHDPDGNPMTVERLIADTTGMSSEDTIAYLLGLPTATSVAIGDNWAVVDAWNWSDSPSVTERFTWGSQLGTTSSVLGSYTSGVDVGPVGPGSGLHAGLFIGVATGPAATGVPMEYRSTSGAHGTVTATTSIDVTGGGTFTARFVAAPVAGTSTNDKLDELVNVIVPAWHGGPLGLDSVALIGDYLDTLSTLTHVDIGGDYLWYAKGTIPGDTFDGGSSAQVVWDEELGLTVYLTSGPSADIGPYMGSGGSPPPGFRSGDLVSLGGTLDDGYLFLIFGINPNAYNPAASFELTFTTDDYGVWTAGEGVTIEIGDAPEEVTGDITLAIRFTDVDGTDITTIPSGARWYLEITQTGTGQSTIPPDLFGPIITTFTALLGDVDTLEEWDGTQWLDLGDYPVTAEPQDLTEHYDEGHATPYSIAHTTLTRWSGVASSSEGGEGTIAMYVVDGNETSNTASDTLTVVYTPPPEATVIHAMAGDPIHIELR